MEPQSTLLLDTDKALQPFLEAIRESSTPSTIRAVVLKAFSDPTIFAGFDQIKHQAMLQLKDKPDQLNDMKTLFQTLDLFSYGMYQDYLNAAQTYMSLTETQIQKLRQLTVLSLVERACSAALQQQPQPSNADDTRDGGLVLSYQTIAQALNVASPLTQDSLRHVEQIAISCIYAGVVSGTLCQRTQSLRVSSEHGMPCRPRDISPSTTPGILLSQWTAWMQQLQDSRNSLHQAQRAIQSKVDAKAQYWNSVDERKKKAESASGNMREAAAWRDAGGSMSTERRTSSSRQRQTKRSRGGFGGALESFRF